VFSTLADWALGVLRPGGPLGLAAVMLVENLFPPIPSEGVLPFAGYLVGLGDLGFATALLAATAGSTVGALALYAVGRWGGRPMVLRWHPLLRLTERDLDRADEWFDRKGGRIVLFGRMVPLLRSAVSIPAGASEMPLRRFTMLTAAGSGMWNALLIGAGVAVGERHQEVSRLLGTYSAVVLGALLIIVLGVAAWWLRGRRSRPGRA
jgi:membrane protein DedA with SNARE-associated domain